MMDIEVNGIRLRQIEEYLWEIPATGGMRVPGRIYISYKMIKSGLQNDESLKQVMNVAHLPGIKKYSLAMPDIHWGYGFPIGGVAATDMQDGVISPGGVGYDINCGVRLATTSLNTETVQPKLGKLINNLFNTIPTGVGAKGAIKKLSSKELKQLTEKGASWAVERGYGEPLDIEHTEERGHLAQANYDCVSDRAYERGMDQVGTLGSGNHFLEVDIVDEIFDTKTAETFGLFKDQIVVLIHTGSRGFGYQICDDYLKLLVQANKKYHIDLPDRQLACAPVSSEEGKQYFAAMSAAANFAWNNRQVIMSLAKQAFLDTFSIQESDLRFNLLYDVCHNIAKAEEHIIEDTLEKVCVHRKGATRAFPPHSPHLPDKFKMTGQPVLIPGDMGRYSFVCVGTEKAMQESFGSSCHGAGRVQSRTKALKDGKGRDLIKELKDRGIIIQAKGYNTIAEEMPEAYKDVQNVVDVMHNSGITLKVAKLKPIGVIKG